ncbi:MAG: hypothetical protein EBZ47_03905 [Chlamydiae bacterium]|nr:hypothetical protein [Chlamydiota bacterium]
MYRFNIILFLFFIVFYSFLHAGTSCLQLSSFLTQAPDSGKGTPAKFEQQILVKNFLVNSNSTRFGINEDGVYFIEVSANIGGISGASLGWVDIWLNKNNQPVPGTNSRMTVDTPSTVASISFCSIVDFKAGDEMSVLITASGPGLGVIAIKPDIEPYIPSLSVSVFKVD